MLSSAPEATLATFRSYEFIHNVKAGLHHRHDHQLRDAFHWIQGESGIAAIPTGDH
jgi:hypothetical protein